MKVSQRLVIAYIQTKFKILALVSKKRAAAAAFELFCTPYMKSKPQVPSIFKAAQSIYFKLDDRKIVGWEFLPANEAGYSKTILILHGFGSAAYKFKSYIKPLTQKGYRVLAFDAPAHGYSDGKMVNAVIYSMMIREIASIYGMPDGFIAHSFGGIALSLALENLPHSIDTRVVLIAPATETSTAVRQAFTMLALHNQAVQAAFHQLIFEAGGKPTAWYSIRRAMKNIQASVLWVHDEQDEITPVSDVIKVQEDQLANIQFIITKGLGHRKIYHDSAVKKQVVEFL